VKKGGKTEVGEDMKRGEKFLCSSLGVGKNGVCQTNFWLREYRMGIQIIGSPFLA
jgi:hypothetical protein